MNKINKVNYVKKLENYYRKLFKNKDKILYNM